MVDREAKRCKKTFNVVSGALIDQLCKLFGHETSLAILRSELDAHADDKARDHVPATKFFDSLNLVTNDPGVAVGDLIMNKDEKLFTGDIGVNVPIIDALNLRDKWPKLTEKNKEMLWDYLTRLADCSAKVAIFAKINDPEFVRAVSGFDPTGAMEHLISLGVNHDGQGGDRDRPAPGRSAGIGDT